MQPAMLRECVQQGLPEMDLETATQQLPGDERIPSRNAWIAGFAHSLGTNTNGNNHEVDQEEQRNMERATREVAEWQT